MNLCSRKHRKKGLSRCAAPSVALLVGLGGSFSAQAIVVWDQGFEVDDSGWLDNTNGWQGLIERLPSGANSIASSTGVAHAYVQQAPPGTSPTGPFTRFDGYRTDFGGGFEARIDIYLDLDWNAGEGFDYSVAASKIDNTGLRDFIFHVTQDTSTGDLLIGGSNNTNFDPREDLETTPGFASVTQAGWYTFRHVFREEIDGSLAVDLIVEDSLDNEIYKITRNNTADLISGPGAIVGGNRYGWFTNIDIFSGLEIDNHQLILIPEPASMMVFAGLATGIAVRRRSRSQPLG